MSKKTNATPQLMFYRIISTEEWLRSKTTGTMPRCRSDERQNCVHLTIYEDIVLVANAYLIKKEKPVVIKVDAELFKDQVTRASPTAEKPWHQPNVHFENIPYPIISRFCPLHFNDQLQTFEMPESFT